MWDARIEQPGITHGILSRSENRHECSRNPTTPDPELIMTGHAKSTRSLADDARPKNKLLAGLPRAEFERLRPLLRTTPIEFRQILLPANQPVKQVYFLNGGVASLTTGMKDGAMVEIATIGDEGLVGITAFFGEQLVSGEAMLQVPDTDAEVMSVDAFRSEVARGGPFHDCVQRYSQGLLTLMMQSTGCLALHPVQERCCRWLLMTHDRVHQDEFHLSHEFLAMMLGTTRPTVTIVAGTLQKAGLIKYTYGRITILDRPRLEAASCECYATVKEHFNRLGL
jgi:CRP-like cAMP-binding protein